MTTPPSSILDPVTGLPLDQYSGIVQQIPLGQQVFPFADLDADGRMTRQPIYGDDVLPTTALITGQDTTGAARAGTMDTARRLYTREAVFQNLGQPIPDGSTAPVDVNVVSGGGGGGGGSVALITDPSAVQWFEGTSPFSVIEHQFSTFPFTIYGWSMGYTIDPATWTPPVKAQFNILLRGHTTNKQIYIGGSMVNYYTASIAGETIEHHIPYPYPGALHFTAASFPGDTVVDLMFNCQNIDITFSGTVLYKEGA